MHQREERRGEPAGGPRNPPGRQRFDPREHGRVERVHVLARGGGGRERLEHAGVAGHRSPPRRREPLERLACLAPLRLGGVDRRQRLRQRALGDRVQQRLARAEVRVDGLAGDPRRLGDLAHPRLGPVGQDGHGRVEDRRDAAFGVGAHGAQLSARRPRSTRARRRNGGRRPAPAARRRPPAPSPPGTRRRGSR